MVIIINIVTNRKQNCLENGMCIEERIVEEDYLEGLDLIRKRTKIVELFRINDNGEKEFFCSAKKVLSRNRLC